MEFVTKSPGLQQVSEDIFKLLDLKRLMNCRLVNSSWKNVFDQLIFWIKKLNEMKGRKGNKIEDMYIIKSWKMLAQEMDTADDLSNDFVLILIKFYQIKKLQQPLDIVVELEEAKKNPDLIKFILEHEDIFSSTGEIMDTEGCVIGCFFNPIHLAAFYGHTATVEKLLGKYDSSTIKDENGDTPILRAVEQGHIEVVKFLVTKIKDPNEPADENGDTPIH